MLAACTPLNTVPDSRARAASTKESPVDRATYSMTSPPASHPKQWNRSGTPPTDSDAVESSWKGQQPMNPWPRRVNSTPLAATTVSVGWERRSAATSKRSLPWCLPERLVAGTSPVSALCSWSMADCPSGRDSPALHRLPGTGYWVHDEVLRPTARQHGNKTRRLGEPRAL